MVVDIPSTAEQPISILSSNNGFRQDLNIGYLNIRGQTGLTIVKQLQIEAFIKHNHCDILHLQEANIEDDSFSTCNFINSTYNILQNNSINKYGTASLIKNDLQCENIQMDSDGRIIIFDVGELTLTKLNGCRKFSSA